MRESTSEAVAGIAADVIDALSEITGSEGVIRREEERLVYDCDAFTLVRRLPGLVVLPDTTEQVVAIVRLLAGRGIPFVPRGAGTGLAGGTLATNEAVLIGLNRMTRIRRIDLANRWAEVEAGVVNVKLSRAVAEQRLHFAPDPSSQSASTIGGNVATNAGGPHTLKYGVTTQHVLGVELVTPEGELIRTGGTSDDLPGIDVTGLIVGSEGTLGIVTAATVRLTRTPLAVRTALAVFETIDDATQTVSAVIAAGIVPAAMELMDRPIIAAVEAAFAVGLPLDAGAVLIVEVDGVPCATEEAMRDVVAICARHGARRTTLAENEEQRALLWKARKRAAGAFGRLTPNYCTQDGVVPRSELPTMLREVAEIGRRHDLRIANLVHAGDGNIHPILMYDERDAAQVARVLAASREILRACIRRGGTISGEHGVGVEKVDFLPMLFSPAELDCMLRLRRAFDSAGVCNPGKMLPDGKGCWEVHRPGRRAPL
ncbi:MAG: putative FAD-linked oxidoreductase [Phycisphaerae bacterium]|nr:putative FAD-linked oxidoreductase [Phycisphaerae bacterium]